MTDDKEKCPACFGTGFQSWMRTAYPGEAGVPIKSQTPCPECGGNGLTRKGTVRPIIAWFHPSDWEELKQLCPPGDLQDTYDEWLQNAEAGVRAFGLGPYDFEKIVLTPDDLRNWRATKDGKIDSKARTQLAVEIVLKRKKTNH